MPTRTEQRVIRSQLEDVAHDRDVEILAAKAYGSRSTGLEDAGSDYDVMFIYLSPPTTYMSDSQSDTIRDTVSPSDNDLGTEIELHGWNLQKYIGSNGLAGSNPTAIACANSPVTYFMDARIADRFESMESEAVTWAKPYALIMHQRSKAENNYRKYIQQSFALDDGVSWGEIWESVETENGPWNYLQEEAVENVSVDPDESQVTEYGVDVIASTDVAVQFEHIPADRALDLGYVRETTLDRTVKRYLNICEALIRARYVEDTSTVPLETVADVLGHVRAHDLVSEDVCSEILDLFMEKKAGDGDEIVRDADVINSWVESELQRDIDPEPYVQQEPDRAILRADAERIAETIWGDSDAV